MVLNVNEDIVLFRLLQQFLVMLEQLHCGFCDENMDSALNGIQSNGIVSGVGRKDCD